MSKLVDAYSAFRKARTARTVPAPFSVIWDTAGAKDLGTFTITSSMSFVSNDTHSIVGGFTQATLIADGTHVPLFDAISLQSWNNTAGARNLVKLQRTGNSKYWTVSASLGIPVTLPTVLTAPTIGTAPTLLVATLGTPITWTAASNVAGNPTPTVTYDILIGGTVVAAGATSGSYTPTSTGIATVRATATNSRGSVTALSNAITIVSQTLFVISADTGGSGGGSSQGYYTTSSTVANQRLDSNMQYELLGTGSPGALTLYFPAFCVQAVGGYTASLNTVTLDSAAVVYNGVNYPLTFTGSSSVTLDSSQPFQKCDPITIPGITLPATIHVRTGIVTTGVSQKIPTQRNLLASAEQAVLGGTSTQAYGTAALVTTGAGAGGSANVYGYGASAVLSNKPSTSAIAFMVQGDSIATGNAAVAAPSLAADQDTHGNIGYPQLGIRSLGYNFVTFARGSNQAKYSTPSVVSVSGNSTGSTVATGLYTLCPYVTHVFDETATNDFNAGATLAYVKAWKLAMYAAYKAAGCIVIAAKVLQRTTSANVPIGTAFDPAGTNLVGQYNDWLDTLVTAGTIDFVYNPRPPTESTTTPGTWSDYANQTSDGTHFNAAVDSGIQETHFKNFLTTVVIPAYNPGSNFTGLGVDSSASNAVLADGLDGGSASTTYTSTAVDGGSA